MASEKNERLVNLTIALLATKKFLTKAQIFKAVVGYEGSSEATDRMFERDKEELRSLGIEIEMKSIDPLFDDEIGYRILPERFRFNIGEVTGEELALMALASEAWKESALADVALSTSVRLQSLGINADFSELPLAPTISNVPGNITEILEAIDANKAIKFEYLNLNNEAEAKEVAPLGIYSQNARWYLFAMDLGKQEQRSYRLDRISSEIKRSAKNFVKPEFNLPSSHFPQCEVLMKVRRDHASELIINSELIGEEADWITYKKSFISENVAISEILKYSSDVVALQPITVVSGVTAALSRLRALHG
jgi:proteasome accessory factor B